MRGAVVAVIVAWRAFADAKPEAIDISAGMQHACAVTKTGEVVCWGSHAYDRVVAPTLMPGIADAIGVAAGRDYSCAVTKIGAVWCWSYRDPLKPARVAGIDDATQLA